MLRTLSEPMKLAAATDRWLALVSAVERLSAADDFASIVEIVRQSARAISGADGVTFVLRDQDRCHYVEEDAIGPLWKGKRFPMSACISGWCMLNGRMAVIPDIYKDPRIPQDAYGPTFVKSLVMTPVGGERPLAAIGAYWRECRDFSETELALLEALGRSTAAAIAAAGARETLHDNEERLRLALDAGRLGAWDIDFASEELVASPLLKEIFGYAAEAPFGLADLMRAIHRDDAERLRAAFDHAVAAQADMTCEFRIRRPDREERWIQVRGRATDSAGARMAGCAADVTERNQARGRIQALQSELAHIARLNELGHMSSAFAHELNQPLSAATNYLAGARRILAGETPSIDRALDAIGRAEAQFARAGDIIRRIRGFIGKGQPAQAHEPIEALVAGAVEIARVNPRHWDVAIELALPPGLPAIFVDKVQVQQVLLNLMRNAFEALEGCPEKRVVVSAAPAADGVELRVADTGPGLSAEVAARLFEPFVTTKAEGMGVGLSICRKIIEGQGGRMWADLDRPRGAAFCFTLPTEAPDA